MADTIIWVQAIGTVLAAILCILGVAVVVGTFVLPESWAVAGVWLLLYRFVAKTENKYCRIAVEMAASVSAGSALSLFTSVVPVWPSVRAPLLLLIGPLFSICHPMNMAFLGSLPVGGFIGAFVWHLGLSTSVPSWLAGWIVALCSLVCALVFACTRAMVALEGMLLPTLGVLLILMSLATLAPSTGFLTPALVMEVSSSSSELHHDLQRTGAYWAGIAMAIVAFHALLERRASNSGNGQQVKLSTKLMPEQQGAADAERGQGMNLPAKDSGLSRLPALTKAIYDENDDLSGFSENEKKIIMICRDDEDERNRILWGGGLY